MGCGINFIVDDSRLKPEWQSRDIRTSSAREHRLRSSKLVGDIGANLNGMDIKSASSQRADREHATRRQGRHERGNQRTADIGSNVIWSKRRQSIYSSIVVRETGQSGTDLHVV